MNSTVKSASLNIMPGNSNSLTVTVSANTPVLSRYEVYELTMSHSGNYTNPWEDLAIQANFRSPAGAVYTVGGFYYDTNTWKLRFAAPMAGLWSWDLSFSNGSKNFQTSGTVSVTEGTRSGFLRVHPANPRRFVTEGDNKPFYVNGLNDCVDDNDDNGQLDWRMDGLPAAVSSSQYFSAYAAAGLNMFRHVPGKCGFVLHDWQRFNANNTGKNFYLVESGKLMDELAAELHRQGMKYFVSMLAIPQYLVPNFSLSNTTRRQALLNYHKYLIDRYGAYADVWELMNEQEGVPASYYNTVTAYIRAYDPYKHPITTSNYERPVSGVTGIELSTPHSTYRVDNLNLDLEMISGTYGLNSYKSRFLNQPVFFADAGNYGPVSNYDPNRYRIGIWSTMFSEGGVLYWHNGARRELPGGNERTNMFIGPEERALAKIFTDFVTDFDVLAKPVNVTLAPSSIRGYVLGSNRMVGGYFLNSASHSSTTSGGRVTVTVPASGMQGQWIDPKTGAVVQTFSPAAGSQTLAIPSFTADIVLRIR